MCGSLEPWLVQRAQRLLAAVAQPPRRRAPKAKHRRQNATFIHRHHHLSDMTGRGRPARWHEAQGLYVWLEGAANPGAAFPSEMAKAVSVSDLQKMTSSSHHVFAPAMCVQSHVAAARGAGRRGRGGQIKARPFGLRPVARRGDCRARWHHGPSSNQKR